MDLRFGTALSDMFVCNAPVQGTDLDILGAKLLIPGDPDRSLLLQRMLRRDDAAMPPLASTVADVQGGALLKAWIGSLTYCP